MDAAIGNRVAPSPGRPWLDGRRVVVTAGGTREPIDPVRFIGNRSSGRMGNALAVEAHALGARVTLVTAAAPPRRRTGVEVVGVETAEDMLRGVRRALPGSSLLLMAAAVADYRPAETARQKLKKRDTSLHLLLIPTTDILRSLRDDPARGGVVVVGFAAETENMVEHAAAKLREKGMDLIVLNDVSRSDIGMGSTHNAVTILDRHGIVSEVARSPKRIVARVILEAARPFLPPTEPAAH